MKIEWLKNKLKKKFYPYTHEKAVLCGENSDKTLDVRLGELLPKDGTAADAEKLGGKNASEYAGSEHTHSVEDIENFPESMPPSEHSHSVSDIDDFPTAMPPTAHKHLASDITGLPETMPPSEHEHSASDVSAGTFSGKVVANAEAVANLGDKQTRNSYAGTTELVSGSSALPTGDIYIQYE